MHLYFSTGQEGAVPAQQAQQVYGHGCDQLDERAPVHHGAIQHAAENGRDHGVHTAPGQGKR